MTRLLVGLGNPGSEYAKHRHNLGFWAVDQLAKEAELSFKPFKSGLLAQLPGESSYILKPQSFMNNSGQVIQEVMNYFEVASSQLAVALDDVYLAPGCLRIRQGGGDGGHNGLKSIIAHIKAQDFWRIRYGAGIYHSDLALRQHQPPLEQYVLQPFPVSEEKLARQMIDRSLPDLLNWLRTGETFLHQTLQIEEK